MSDANLITNLTDVACGYVPSSRPAKPNELAAMKRFLLSYGVSPQNIDALIKTGLSGKRPRPTFNAQMAELRAAFSYDERVILMRHLYRLMFDIDGQDARLTQYTHFLGTFLGVREPQMAALRDEAARGLTPRAGATG
jgi:uncharacterized tellurite resistance protein B-like protein